MTETKEILKQFNNGEITAESMNEQLDSKLDARGLELEVHDDGAVSINRG